MSKPNGKEDVTWKVNRGTNITGRIGYDETRNSITGDTCCNSGDQHRLPSVFVPTFRSPFHSNPTNKEPQEGRPPDTESSPVPRIVYRESVSDQRDLRLLWRVGNEKVHTTTLVEGQQRSEPHEVVENNPTDGNGNIYQLEYLIERSQRNDHYDKGGPWTDI